LPLSTPRAVLKVRGSIYRNQVLGATESVASSGILAFGRITGLGARDPQDWEVASEFFKVAIGSNECGILRDSKSRGNAIRIRDLVKRFEFSGLESLGKINRNDLERKERQVVDRLPGSLLALVPPEPIEDFTQVNDGNHERGIAPEGLSKDALHGCGAGAILNVVQDGIGVEDVSFCRRLQYLSSLCSRSRASTRESPPLHEPRSLCRRLSNSGEGVFVLSSP